MATMKEKLKALRGLELIGMFKKRMGKNFMTPNIIGYQVKGNRVIEFSKGEFLGKTLYGVTVRDYVNGMWQEQGFSKSFKSKRLAKSHIEKVLSKIKLKRLM